MLTMCRTDRTPAIGARVRSHDGKETTLQTYLREIQEVALLSAAEEKLLARRIAAGDPDARDLLIRANLRLVVSIARRFKNRGLPIEDLIAEGNLGLLASVRRFDPSMNTRFSTYAALWIIQSIQRGLMKTASTIRLPANMVALLSKWRWTGIHLEKELGRTPTEEEIADRLGLSKKQLGVIRRSLRIQNASMQSDSPMEGITFEEMLVDRSARSPSALLDAVEEWEVVQGHLSRMDERAAFVLRQRFGLDGEEPKTLEEVGSLIDLTRERVRQIERAALERLRATLSTPKEPPAGESPTNADRPE